MSLVKRVTTTTALALALAAPAQANQRHTWFFVNYAQGKCSFSVKTPEETYNEIYSFGAQTGMTVNRISPNDVDKDDNGNIHVHMTGTKDGEFFSMDFFTTIRACEQYIKLLNVKPSQARSGDIN